MKTIPLRYAIVAVGFLRQKLGPVMSPGHKVASFNPFSLAIVHATFSALSLPKAYHSCHV